MRLQSLSALHDFTCVAAACTGIQSDDASHARGSPSTKQMCRHFSCSCTQLSMVGVQPLVCLQVRSVMVFCATCRGCHLLSLILEELGIACAALHSQQTQGRRLAALDKCDPKSGI